MFGIKWMADWNIYTLSLELLSWWKVYMSIPEYSKNMYSFPWLGVSLWIVWDVFVLFVCVFYMCVCVLWVCLSFFSLNVPLSLDENNTQFHFSSSDIYSLKHFTYKLNYYSWVSVNILTTSILQVRKGRNIEKHCEYHRITSNKCRSYVLEV